MGDSTDTKLKKKTEEKCQKEKGKRERNVVEFWSTRK